MPHDQGCNRPSIRYMEFPCIVLCSHKFNISLFYSIFGVLCFSIGVKVQLREVVDWSPDWDKCVGFDLNQLI